MVESQLRTSGITDRRLLMAMGELPREDFVLPARRELAYIDEAQPMLAARPERRMPAPVPFARLVQLAAIGADDHVLDLGMGTGYSTAILARLAAVVVGVEEDSSLAELAHANIAARGFGNVDILAGPLATAGRDGAPYDVILFEGMIDSVPEELFAQLKSDGRVVASVGNGLRPAVATIFAKSGKGIAAQPEFDATLPPLRPAARAEEFAF
jgi:protein-L-isoaspartate(D-aspartate) O-methyltransferase